MAPQFILNHPVSRGFMVYSFNVYPFSRNPSSRLLSVIVGNSPDMQEKMLEVVHLLDPTVIGI